MCLVCAVVSVQLSLKVAIGVESDPYPPCSTGAVATRAFICYSNHVDLVLADKVQCWEGTKLLCTDRIVIGPSCSLSDGYASREPPAIRFTSL